MADFTVERLTPRKLTFSDVGINCVGPIFVKSGQCQEKRYGCIFTKLSILRNCWMQVPS